ncbi:MAG: EAL domain-containing protein [Burkholderiaceae bacterium]
MNGSYNFWTVALSLAVAVLAAYTALSLASRITAATGRVARGAWLAAGAIAMGVGIWSMHFIGMLAFALPIPTGYALLPTLLSLCIAILASFLALYLASRQTLRWEVRVAGGITMGAGIACMHYIGMAAMQMSPVITYDPLWFSTSIVIAIGASILALMVFNALSIETQSSLLAKRLGASVILAIGITGMHYSGMAAAGFADNAICMATGDVGTETLTWLVAITTLTILLITLLVASLEGRHHRSQRMLTGSLNKLNLALLRMATHDELTNLPNRASLVETLAHTINRAQKRSGGLAVLFMDLDGFKSINDSLGHTIGDGMLRAFADRLRQVAGPHDFIARLGGDEFVVIVDRDNAEEATKLCVAITRAMGSDLVAGTTSLRVTPSIGVALYPQDGETVDALLKHADIAMYGAKEDGRNTFRFYESSMGAKATRMLLIQKGLQEALANDRFTLHFQPKFTGGNQAMTGAEALLRWTHPELGPMTPSEFIPVAERSGQIIAIGNWVLSEVCRYLRMWDAQGKTEVKMAVNLSPQQLRQPDVAQKLHAIVKRAGVAPSRIMFEITETVAMQDAALTSQILAAFHASGFEVAIDDFGTGYSSLAYLQQFRVKQLKIDRFFTNGLDTHGQEGRAIVGAIVALAHSLNMEVVAEGVETGSQLALLRSMNCDQVQGFWLEKPMNAETFETFLSDRNTSPPTSGGSSANPFLITPGAPPALAG